MLDSNSEKPDHTFAVRLSVCSELVVIQCPSMQPFCPELFGYPVPLVNAALDHSPWIFHWVPFEKGTKGTLNVQAHLSPFSCPRLSYQAPGLAGSLRASDSSWPLTFESAAKPSE